MSRFSTRDYLLMGLMVIVAGVCVRLGIWQLDRLGQRMDRNAEIRARLDEPVLEFPPPIPLEEQAYRRISVRGTFQPEQAVLLENQSYNEQPGFHLLVPLILENLDTALVIDQGWLPFEQVLGKDPRVLVEETAGEQTIEGVLLPSQDEPALAFLADKIPAPGEPPLRAWRVVNIDGLQKQTPFALYPLYLARTAPPSSTEGGPLPVFEPDLSNGPHLSYAIQWFAFASIALFGGAAWLRYRNRAGPRVRREQP
jgi:surfeit locus 1 family protein